MLLPGYDGRKGPPIDESTCVTNGTAEKRSKSPSTSDGEGNVRGTICGSMPQVRPGREGRGLMAEFEIGPELCHVGSG